MRTRGPAFRRPAELHVQEAEPNIQTAESHSQVAEAHTRAAELHTRAAESSVQAAAPGTRVTDSHVQAAKAHAQAAEPERSARLDHPGLKHPRHPYRSGPLKTDHPSLPNPGPKPKTRRGLGCQGTLSRLDNPSPAVVTLKSRGGSPNYRDPCNAASAPPSRSAAVFAWCQCG
ncbi:hypothetical protein GCM10027199_18210 [Amycolatopsis magusensis]